MLTLVGMNHRSAPLDLRERACFPEADVPAALGRLLASTRAAEAFIIATCNRVEILTRATDGPPVAGEIRAFLAEERGLSAATIDGHVYVHEGAAAVRHVFSVACGLDSIVLGEPQILGQLKRAYATAREARATGPVLDRLLRHSISAARRVRTATGISRHAVSVAYVATHLARTIFDGLAGRSALLIGAGKMAELAAKHLTSQGLSRLAVTNRTYAKASTLAAALQGVAIPWDELAHELTVVDIVLTGTGAATPVLTKPAVKAALSGRRGRPLFIVDIAVPRDVEPAVHELPGVYLYNVDDLQGVVDEGLEGRKRAAAEAVRLLEVEFAAFERWRQSVELGPTIAALYRHLHGVSTSEIERYSRRLASMTPAQRSVVLDLTRSLIQKVLHTPIVSLKSAAERGEAGPRAALYREIFGIDPREPSGPRGDEKPGDDAGSGPTHAIRGGKNG